MNSEDKLWVVIWITIASVILGIMALVAFIIHTQAPFGHNEKIARIEACSRAADVTSCLRLNG